MSLQVQLEKALSQINFLESTVYEVSDLTHMINPNDKFVVRQGDLIVTNYPIDNYRQRGLRKVWSQRKGNIYIHLGSHVVIPLQEKTILMHPEHGITIIPENYYELLFYTFSDAGD